MYKVEILSDGTTKGTRVIYRGKQLPGVTEIDMHADMEGITATIKFVNVEVDFYDIEVLKNDERKN